MRDTFTKSRHLGAHGGNAIDAEKMIPRGAKANMYIRNQGICLIYE
jgi:hypothetical protein